MVKVTDRAKGELRKLLLLCAEEPETGLRLSHGVSGQFGLVLGREEDGDDIIQCDGLKVLLIGKEFSDLLDDVTIDIENIGGECELVMTKNESKRGKKLRKGKN